MNELKIEFSNESYLYFKTDMKTASMAFDEWAQICDNVGINTDNKK